MGDQLTVAIRLIVAACALIPFVVFLVSYLRTRVTRLLFAALGFGVYVVKEVLLASGVFTVIVRVKNPHAPAVTDSQLALLEAALDLAVIILFVLALLWKQGASTDGKAGAGDQKGSV